MRVHFITPTRISLINLTTIGDSEKREDETKIGKFSSGQAYATALLLRDNVGIEVYVYGGEDELDGKFTEAITYSTTERICQSTNKSKEVIVLNYEKQFHGNCNSIHTFREGWTESQEIETAFALQLGYNWETWMAYRELMSNVLDEGGYVLEQESYPELETGTVITLSFDESNAFYDVWKNKHLYMNFEAPLFKVSDSVEALKNDEGWLRIYKQNILVFEDVNRPSKFAWNIKFGEIDERRILNNVYGVEQSIASAIQNTNNEDFLREIITKDFSTKENEFLSSNGSYSSYISDEIKNIALEVYKKHGDVKSYSWLIDKIKKQKDCKIAGKRITTVEDSLWSYSREVVIESSPVITHTKSPLSPNECFEISPLQKEINKYYNFDLDVEVKIAKLKGSKVVADKYEKCLIIDESFEVEKDFHIFVVEYLDMKHNENVIESLSKYICNLIKK
jgi:hypothetical protein